MSVVNTLSPLLVINQGESQNFSIQLNDQQGNPIDLSSVIGIDAETRIGGQLFKKYSNSVVSGEGLITVDGTITNKISFYVDRPQSINFPAGQNLQFNILVKNPDGSTPLYYNLSYIIAKTDTGSLLTSSI